MILTVINAELLSQENLQDEVVNAPGVKETQERLFSLYHICIWKAGVIKSIHLVMLTPKTHTLSPLKGTCYQKRKLNIYI